jgi:LemA protein
MARRYYNGTVRDFNIAIQSFPDVLISRLTGFHEELFFQADAGSVISPTVSFPGQKSS